MQVAAEHLFFFVAEHLCCRDVGDGDIPVEVDGEDAVADGLEDGVGLAGKGSELAFGANLFADIDAEAEDVGDTARNVDELVAVGDDAVLAVGVREMEEALGFAGLADLFEIGLHGGATVFGDELAEGVVEHGIDGAADGLCTVSVDGDEISFEVVGADDAEGAFDKLAVAGFAFAESGFGGALGGDVDASGDDEADLSLGVAEGSSRPGDAAEGAVAIEPLVFESGGEGAGAEPLEGGDGLGDLAAGDESVPGVAADKGGELVSGGDLAGAVEADDAPGGIEDGNEGTNGVEDGGDEVALYGEGGLDALTGAGGAIHLEDAAVELEASDDLAAEDTEGVGLLGGETTGGGIEDEERADADAAGSGEGSSGVEAVGAAFDVDAVGGEVGVVAGVLDLVDGIAEDGGLAGQAAEG